MSYLSKNYNTKETPQNEPIPGMNMVENSAGGYVFEVDDWKRLRRFLIMGCEGGTYYVGEHRLVQDNAQCVERCIKSDGIRTVNEVVDVSDKGLAAKNDPALFALAMCASLGDNETRKHALDCLPRVARIGTHLFHFAEYCNNMRGWGRGLREAVGKWYTEKDTDSLGYQLVKYRQRDGWSHRDLLRLAHPNPPSAVIDAMFNWVTQEQMPECGFADKGFKFIEAFEDLKANPTVKNAVAKIEELNMPREAIPTELLNDPKVWQAMLDRGMPLGALIRNLGVMSSHGLFELGEKQNIETVVGQITDRDKLQKARIHPYGILLALKTYGMGCGIRGRKSWMVCPNILDALDDAFYASFKYVEPSGKDTLLGIDVSGSMSWGCINGSCLLAPREAAACMAMATARVESSWSAMAFSNTFVRLNITKNMKLNTVINKTSNLPFSGTDCALPMLYALENQLFVDTFIVYTDNETWYGSIHPNQALQKYRKESGKDSKLIVVAFTSTRFTIADPNDAGMLDVVGFDASAPAMMSAFIKGEM